MIDMPPPEDTTWWRGKRGFEVGYFPSECIEMIGDTVPQEMASRIPQTPPKAGQYQYQCKSLLSFGTS